MEIETKKAVVVVALAALFAAGVIFVFSRSQLASRNAPSQSVTRIQPESAKSPESAISLPKPTGNVDDLADDLSTEAATMEKIIEEETSDAVFGETEYNLLDEFGQSYNENEF